VTNGALGQLQIRKQPLLWFLSEHLPERRILDEGAKHRKVLWGLFVREQKRSLQKGAEYQTQKSLRNRARRRSVRVVYKAQKLRVLGQRGPPKLSLSFHLGFLSRQILKKSEWSSGESFQSPSVIWLGYNHGSLDKNGFSPSAPTTPRGLQAVYGAPSDCRGLGQRVRKEMGGGSKESVPRTILRRRNGKAHQEDAQRRRGRTSIFGVQ
jgi:hypothetical protein